MSDGPAWTAMPWMPCRNGHRAGLVNSLSGFKSANLVGTADADGTPGLLHRVERGSPRVESGLAQAWSSGRRGTIRTNYHNLARPGISR